MLRELESHFGDEVSDSRVLKSGWAGEITLVSLKNTNQRVIIKTYASDREGKANLEREWQGLCFLNECHYPVPKPLWINNQCEKPFIVMEAVSGGNLWEIYEKSAEEEQKKLMEGFTRLFYDLHRLNPSITGTVTEGGTGGFIRRELSEIQGLMEQNGFSFLKPAYEWLEMGAASVKDMGLSILHRDYHPWNVLRDKEGKLYVIDWIWGIGDYRFDLLWTTALMARSGFEAFSEKMLSIYEAFLGHEIPDKDYFLALASLRWLMNVLISYKTGQNLNEERKEEFRQFIEPLMGRALETLNRITGGFMTLDQLRHT
ncbi:MAG: aminoglycoside phosphotransferase family protein [Clostridia bacterium]|nr:aminoglycoside phosphotransferase family protein [Clostridia bacterium]